MDFCAIIESHKLNLFLQQGNSSRQLNYRGSLPSNPEEYLEEHGWCKVYRPVDRKREFAVYIGGKHELTDAQMKTLQANGLDNAEGISDMLCKN